MYLLSTGSGVSLGLLGALGALRALGASPSIWFGCWRCWRCWVLFLLHGPPHSLGQPDSPGIQPCTGPSHHWTGRGTQMQTNNSSSPSSGFCFSFALATHPPSSNTYRILTHTHPPSLIHSLTQSIHHSRYFPSIPIRDLSRLPLVCHPVDAPSNLPFRKKQTIPFFHLENQPIFEVISRLSSYQPTRPAVQQQESHFLPSRRHIEEHHPTRRDGAGAGLQRNIQSFEYNCQTPMLRSQ